MMMTVKKPSVTLPDYSSYRGVYIEDVHGYLYDIYEWDGTKTANGIAVLANNCRFVIALQNAHTSECRLGGYKKIVPGIVTTTDESEANADYAGAYNTDTIISELSGYNDSYVTGAPAAEYCKAFTFPNGKKGYLGAAGEWQEVINNKYRIAHALKECGGSLMSPGNWTSTQYSSDLNWTASLLYDTLSDDYKNRTSNVRAFTTLKSDEWNEEGENPYAFSLNIEVNRGEVWSANAE